MTDKEIVKLCESLEAIISNVIDSRIENSNPLTKYEYNKPKADYS